MRPRPINFQDSPSSNTNNTRPFLRTICYLMWRPEVSSLNSFGWFYVKTAINISFHSRRRLLWRSSSYGGHTLNNHYDHHFWSIRFADTNITRLMRCNKFIRTLSQGWHILHLINATNYASSWTHKHSQVGKRQLNVYLAKPLIWRRVTHIL